MAALPEDPAPAAELARLDRVALTTVVVGLAAATGAYALVVALEDHLALQSSARRLAPSLLCSAVSRR